MLTTQYSFSLLSEIPEKRPSSKTLNISDNTIRCNVAKLQRARYGTYKINFVLYIKVYLLFLLRCACKFNRTLFYADIPCPMYCNFLPQSKNPCAVCSFLENHSLFLLSRRARPTHHCFWHAQLIPTEEPVIFLFAVTLAERMIPAPGFAVVNIGWV